MFQFEKNDYANEAVDSMKAAMDTDGYDGKSVDEALGGSRTFTPVHFIETRKYLQQVRDGRRRIELLESRVKYRENAGLPTNYLLEEMDDARQSLNASIAEVAEEISKLHDVGQEMVLTRRYIDCLTWDQVAVALDMKMRTVQKLHGHALPMLEKILLDDGRVEIEEETDSAAV